MSRPSPYRQKVTTYLEEHPGATASQVAKALHLDYRKSYPLIWRVRKSLKGIEGGNTATAELPKPKHPRRIDTQSTPVVFGELQAMKKVVDKFGGLERTQEILNCLISLKE